MIRRDIHALLVLFIMPTAFILIMSLSLQDKFSEAESDALTLGIAFENPEHADKLLGEKLAAIDGYEILVFDYEKLSVSLAEKESLSAMIRIPNVFFEGFTSMESGPELSSITILFAPNLPNYFRQLIVASYNQVLYSYQTEQLLSTIKAFENPLEPENENVVNQTLITQEDFYEIDSGRRPNSVEQTVPSWLIFAMFFVVIPLSTTFLIEKQQGTLQRLKTLPIPNYYFLVGKFLPYFLINLVQMALMFLVGILILPLLGGEGIQLQNNAWLLLPMSASISFTAISFALLVAVVTKTTEQATTIGGVSNLILAALGGIMVPTFVMPEIMQSVARLSPMNWGLEGYLSILLKEAMLVDILPEACKLLVLGSILFLTASFFYGKIRNG